ncbi:MAG: hypothetical protein QJR02_11355 [Sinobacteraceae bacterium]|nr:hypothetical protein [Nevskiaceae bacterium]
MRGAIIFLSALIVAGCGTGTGVSTGAGQEQGEKASRGIGWIERLVGSLSREQTLTVNGFTVVSQALAELVADWPGVGAKETAGEVAVATGPSLGWGPPSRVVEIEEAQEKAKDGVPVPLFMASIIDIAFKKVAPADWDAFYSRHGAKFRDVVTTIRAYFLASGCVAATQPVIGWPGRDSSVYGDWANRQARLLFVANQTFAELMRRAGDSVQRDPEHARRAVQKALLSLTAGEIEALWEEAEKTRSQYETGDMVLNFTGVQGAQWQNGQVGYRLLPTGPEVTVAGADFFGGQGGAIYGGQRTFRVASLIGAEQGESRNVSREQELRQSQGSGADAGVK